MYAAIAALIFRIIIQWKGRKRRKLGRKGVRTEKIKSQVEDHRRFYDAKELILSGEGVN